MKFSKKLAIFFKIYISVFGFLGFSAVVFAAGTVSFTADTIVSLSGISDGSLYVASSSQAASVSVSGATSTISAVPDGDPFIFKTSQHNNALKITPSGGTVDLIFNSAYLSSGNISRWTLTGTGATTVAHIVGTPLANTWYAIKTDGALLNSYQSSAGGEVGFTYSGGWSSKVFTIEQDTTGPTAFSLTSPINSSVSSNLQPAFSWNASTDPDISYYQLYIDNSLNRNNLTNASTTPTNNLSCNSHNWYVRAVDTAGNYTNSQVFDFTLFCFGETLPFIPPIASAPTTSSSATSTAPVTTSTSSTIIIEPAQTTAESIKAKIAEILAKIQDLKAQISRIQNLNTSPPKFLSSLYRGMKNNDVRNLQEILSADKEIYPEGLITGYFGSLTEKAVKRFQLKHKIVASEKDPGYGYVGPKTRKILNEAVY